MLCFVCGGQKCSVCGSCYTCSSHQRYTCSVASTTAPRTQKGIGLTVLGNFLRTQGEAAYLLQIRATAQKPADLFGLTWPLFARPCPSTPKHGYIDSRVVKSQDEAEKLLAEVLADDPLGELLLCDFIQAGLNMIWTPGSMVIGPGHDGATAGKATVIVPLAGNVPSQLKAAYPTAQISGGQWPFIEAVMPKRSGPSGLILTQLRAGPEIQAGGGDYVPKKMTVLKVLKADSTLYKDRDWEKLIDAEAEHEGTVVWHPGGAMTDHFSIHAFTHQIPVIFSKEPFLGDLLEPVEGQDQLKFDPHEILLGALAGEKIKLVPNTQNSSEHCGAAVNTLLIAFHNATVMTGKNSRWLGVATSIMLRLGVTALRGESRHSNMAGLAVKSATKEQIYQKSTNMSLSRHRASVNRLVNLFRYANWPEGSFGGMKWAQCGAATVGLFEAFHELAADPSEKTAAALVRALNVAVNQAHNGGWWLNKFAASRDFASIQEGQPVPILKSAGVVYRAGLIMRSLEKRPQLVQKSISKWAAWPVTSLAPPKVSSVQMTYQPGIAAIGLRYKTRVFGAASQVILAPVETIFNLKDVISGNAFLMETEDGFQVEIRPPGKVPTVLWRDALLKEAAQAVVEKQ